MDRLQADVCLHLSFLCVGDCLALLRQAKGAERATKLVDKRGCCFIDKYPDFLVPHNCILKNKK